MLGGKDGPHEKQQRVLCIQKQKIVGFGVLGSRMMRKRDLSNFTRIRVDIPNTLDDLWTLDIQKVVHIASAEVREFGDKN